MMHEYMIGRSSRRCRVSDRPLKPGERFYSVIVSHQGEIERYEIAEAEWKGPPAEAIGWWRGVVAEATPERFVRASDGELLDRLAQLCDDPDQPALANLLGLLLLRRRLLQEDLDGFLEDREPLQPSLPLVHHSTERRFRVPLIEPDPESYPSLQAALQALLYSEG